MLIVGLGNPGPKYARTRHNIGFMVVDALAAHAGVELSKSRFRARFGSGTVEDGAVTLMQPQTFMNLSGEAVCPARDYFGFEWSEVLVIHDDLDLPLGTLRLKIGGGHGGHNGLRSIIGLGGSADFARLRMGIGRPAHGEVIDHVLSEFSPGDERSQLPDLIERGRDALLVAVREGPRRAMNTVNAPAAR